MKRMAAELAITLGIINALWWLCIFERWITGGIY
jgi:hypothetical protein